MTSAETRFESMVHAYSSDLFRYAYWLCKSRQLAEDLVQETFLRAWRFLDSLKDEGKAKSWLITTLRREHARHYEKARPDLSKVDLDTLPDTDVQSRSDNDTMAVREAIGQLEDSYREPLVLQVLWGYSGEEIADMLDMPRATVNTRLFRARQQLRKVLGGDSEPLSHRS
ncbi:MAG: sigma-70 family RNA polymerase sigma factor [Gammaproteobacteria bacterium]|nr:sigma-70 family RNA polymerase sigma factor [Gammaproteobacteria bacterium]